MSGVWPGPCPSLTPTSPPWGWYLEGLVEEAAPASLLQKLVVLVDAAARKLARQVEPGQESGDRAAEPRRSRPFSRLGMGCTGGLGDHLEEAEDLCARQQYDQPPACPSSGSGQGRCSCPLPEASGQLRIGGWRAEGRRCLHVRLWRLPVATAHTTGCQFLCGGRGGTGWGGAGRVGMDTVGLPGQGPQKTGPNS